MVDVWTLFREAAMNRIDKSVGTREMLNRVASYISESGLTLSFWILSVVFIMGRIFVIPF